MQIEDTDIIEMICNFFIYVPLCTMYIEMTFWTFGQTSNLESSKGEDEQSHFTFFARSSNSLSIIH